LENNYRSNFRCNKYKHVFHLIWAVPVLLKDWGVVYVTEDISVSTIIAKAEDK